MFRPTVHDNDRVTKLYVISAHASQSSLRIAFHCWWSMMLRRSRLMHEKQQRHREVN